MAGNDDIKNIINDFFRNASESDIQELNNLLKKKKKAKPGLGKMDIQGIAENFSSELRERMGLTAEQISKTARDAVRQMIFQYDPSIPEEQIRVLLDKWVPDRGKKQSTMISPEIMRAMISQFVAYGRGELTEEHTKSFPQGWAKKYWSNFPEKIQRLIDAYIKGRLKKSEFWASIEEMINNKF